MKIYYFYDYDKNELDSIAGKDIDVIRKDLRSNCKLLLDFNDEEKKMLQEKLKKYFKAIEESEPFKTWDENPVLNKVNYTARVFYLNGNETETYQATLFVFSDKQKLVITDSDNDETIYESHPLNLKGGGDLLLFKNGEFGIMSMRKADYHSFNQICTFRDHAEFIMHLEHEGE